MEPSGHRRSGEHHGAAHRRQRPVVLDHAAPAARASCRSRRPPALCARPSRGCCASTACSRTTIARASSAAGLAASRTGLGCAAPRSCAAFLLDYERTEYAAVRPAADHRPEDRAAHARRLLTHWHADDEHPVKPLTSLPIGPTAAARWTPALAAALAIVLAAAPQAQRASLVGAGATFPYPIYSRMVRGLRQAQARSPDLLSVRRIGRRHPPADGSVRVLRRDRHADDGTGTVRRASPHRSRADSRRRRRADLQHPGAAHAS